MSLKKEEFIIQKENKVLNQWTRLNHILHAYKIMGLGLLGLASILSCLCFYLASQKPIVIQDRENDFFYFIGERKPISLTKKNVERFVSAYIKMRYKWDQLDPNSIVQDIIPFTTKKFQVKTKIQLEKMISKDFKDKKLKQGISDIEVRVEKSDTIAIFDRILRINGIPLLIPTQISFGLAEGKKTIWNKMGLYITGVSIHENH